VKFRQLPDLSRFRAKGADVSPTSDLLTKASHMELRVKASADGKSGIIEGYGSLWDKVDSYNEAVVKGAFTDSLVEWRQRNKPIPMLWQHRSDQPIGGWRKFSEDDQGLYLEGTINLETQRGKEAFSDIEGEYVTGLSIGYYEVEADAYQWAPNAPPRKLRKLDLREISPVTFPALREAQIDAVKARMSRGERLTIREFEGLLREKLALSRSDAEVIATSGYKAWLQREVGQAAFEDDPAELVRQMRSTLEQPLALPTL